MLVHRNAFPVDSIQICGFPLALWHVARSFGFNQQPRAAGIRRGVEGILGMTTLCILIFLSHRTRISK